MKKNRVFFNLFTGIFSQVVIIVLGLIVPKIIINNYGSDTNGLTSTITQIFSYLALLEAGISTAARNALYKPIKENDKEGVSFWMSSSRRYYRKISYIYLLAVAILSISLPFIFKTEVSYWTIFFYIIFEGITSIISFYFINTWTCFLGAKGDNYIVNTLALFNKLLCLGAKIILALLSVNIVYIQVGYFVASLIQLGIYYVYMKKKYSWIDYKKAPKDVKLKDRNAFIVNEIAWTIFSSTDMIILSTFVATTLASVYSVYNMVFIALNGLISSAYSSINYLLGQTFVEDIEKYKRIHDGFNSVFMALITALMGVCYFLIIPFIKLYTANITDVEYVYEWLPLLFCLVQMLSWSRYVAGNLVGIAGYAKQISVISLIEAIINVVVSIVLVNIWGITGVLLATVVALPIKVIICNYLADIKIMKRSSTRTIIILGVNFLLFGICVIIRPFVNFNINDFISFCKYGVILTLLFILVSAVVNIATNPSILKTMSNIIKRRDS